MHRISLLRESAAVSDFMLSSLPVVGTKGLIAWHLLQAG